MTRPSNRKGVQTVKLIRNAAILLLTFSLFLVLHSRAQTSAPFDLVITGGHIVDGTGSPWYSGDIGIRDGRVAAIGNLQRGRAPQHHRRAREGGRARLY